MRRPKYYELPFQIARTPNLTGLPIGERKGEARFAPTNVDVRHSRILIRQLV
jgi:hypothetical protein